MTDVQVRDNPEQSRFDILVDGAVSGFAAYRVRGGRTIITHSEVDPSFRGRGLGSRLAEGTLDQLRGRHATVVASCPFFAQYVAEHHDWDDILADA